MINKIYGFNLTCIFISGLLLISMTACGSAPARQPAAIEQAEKVDQEAHRALRDGDLARAHELFRLSMLSRQSLDNQHMTALAAINLSFVSHKLGKHSDALDLLDGILSDSAEQIPAELRAAAAFRKGIILADIGKTAEAESALQLAMRTCNKECTFVPGMNNLSARLAFNQGNNITALALAKGVINDGADKSELANAHRIAAQAESAQGQYESALIHYQSALELDKELALSSRVAEDLRGIAMALEKLGRTQEAEVFAHRAESVALSARLLRGNATKNIRP